MKQLATIATIAAMWTLAAFGDVRERVPEVAEAMVRVNEKWQREHPLSGEWNGQPYAEESPFWNKAAYHIGNLAAARSNALGLEEHGRDEKWRAYSLRWARGADWKGARGDDKKRWKYSYGEKPEFVLFGDWQACFQVYAELDGNLARALEVFDYETSLEADDFIWWSDGIFMVMPTMTHLALRHPDRRVQYLGRLSRYWTFARALMRDGETGLFFRDARYVYPRHKTARGLKDFWARGNGWVAAALARCIDDLDAMDEKELRAEFAAVFRSLMDGVIACQRPEGHWTRSLLDPEQAPGFETSGTAFFAYALAWGIEKRLVDEKAAPPSLEKAWRYLLGTAVQGDGTLGYVQPIGDRAVPGQVVTARSTADFGVGAFLLAASKFVTMRQAFDGVIVFARGGDRFAFMRRDDGQLRH
jgi:hypothetical protein